MGDYHRVKKDQKRGHHVTLAQHKWQVDGPAVIFTKELKEMLDVYVEKILPYFPKPKDPNLFLNNSGKAFAGAKISTRAPVLAENRSPPGHTSDCNQHQKMDR